MADLESLPDAYFATCLTDEDIDLLSTAINFTHSPLLPLIEKLTAHIAQLQDQIHYRYNGCTCYFYNPGDICLQHEKEEKQWWQLNH